MAKIKITDRMAEAMLDTDHVGQGDISWGGMGHSTCNGLVARGLVESRLLRNGDAPGYAGRYPDVKNWHAFLTPAGRIVQADLRADAERRTWTEEELVPQAETDVDAGRLTLEEAQEEAQTAGLMGELSVVRIGYVDGTTEEIRNIPPGPVAAGIFAEAVDNDRVAAAELVRGDGTVAASYPTRDPMARVMVVPGVCGRHVGEDVARAYGRKSLAACARMPSHLGRHRNTRAITVLTLHWTDEQCAPLDPQPEFPRADVSPGTCGCGGSFSGYQGGIGCLCTPLDPQP